MTTFTLLLPVYSGNSPAQLHEAFESSVHRQTRRPDAVVVTVDGPIGEELEAELLELTSTSPSPVRLVRIPDNRGTAGALNLGLEQIETEYVARMDADDVSLPERFERQIAEVEDRDLDILGSGIAEFVGTPDAIVGLRTPPVGDEIHRRAPWAQPFNHPTVVFRLAAVRSAGGYPTDVGRIEDYVLFARMLNAGARADNLSDVLVMYRVDDGVWERRGGWRMFRDELRLQRELRRTGLTSRGHLIRNVVLRGGYRLAPTWLRSRAYRSAARRRAAAPLVDSTSVSGPIDRRRGRPRFSIVIPAYNAEKHIARSLRSILRQTLPPHEVLVYDDGSTDGTADAVAAFSAKHPVVRLIRQSNTGQGAVRNRGVREAEGDWVLFLDSDDGLDPSTLERCSAAIESDDPELVAFRFQARYPAGVRGYESRWTPEVAGRQALDGDDTELLLTAQWLASWQCAYQLDFLRRNGLRNGEGYIFEDQEFTAGAFIAADRVALIDAPLYRYHYSGSSSLREKSDAALRRRIDGRRLSREALVPVIDRLGATERARAILADHDVHDFVQEIVLGIYTDDQRAEVLESITTFLNAIAPVRAQDLEPPLADWYARPRRERDAERLAEAARQLAIRERDRVSRTFAFRFARRIVGSGEGRSETPDAASDALVDESFARVFRAFPHRMLRRLGTAAGPAVRAVRRVVGEPS